MVFEVGAHPLAQEHRVVALEDPFAGAVPEGFQALVGFQLVQCRVVRQVQQDHVVEVPAVGDVVPAEEPDAVLVGVLPHLPGEQRLHVELEERVATAADREVGREHGHAAASSGLRSSWPAWRPAPAGDRRRLLSHGAFVGRGFVRGRIRRLGRRQAERRPRSRRPRPRSRRPSSSPLASGRRRVRRSAATSRSRKMIVWPATSSSTIVSASRTTLIQIGHSQATLSGVRTIATTSTTAGTGSSRGRVRARRRAARPCTRSGAGTGEVTRRKGT